MTNVKPNPQSRTTGKTAGGSNAVPNRKRVKVTKKARLIGLLSKNSGSDIASISKKFGWLPHTTRAALTGLRKAGYEISSMKAGTGKPTKYRITGAPEEKGA